MNFNEQQIIEARMKNLNWIAKILTISKPLSDLSIENESFAVDGDVTKLGILVMHK